MFLTRPRNFAQGETGPAAATRTPKDRRWHPAQRATHGRPERRAPPRNGERPHGASAAANGAGWRRALLSALSADVSRATHDVVLRYGAAVLSVFVAATVTFALLRPVFSRNPFPLFYAAVIFAAWYGGIGASLVATGLSVWAIDYLFLPSLLRFDNFWHDIAQVGSFVFIAGLVGWLEARRRHAMGGAASRPRPPPNPPTGRRTTSSRCSATSCGRRSPRPSRRPACWRGTARCRRSSATTLA